MIVQNFLYQDSQWVSSRHIDGEFSPQLVIFFASKQALAQANCYESLRELFPASHIVGCSTSGEILGEEVYDDSAVATAIYFQQTTLSLLSCKIDHSSESYAKGLELSAALEKEGLKSVFMLSDGQNVNGTALIRGLQEHLDDQVILTGGLAGDGPHFKETLVAADCPPETGRIVIVGFYGEAIRVGYGSAGGWDSFGPERLITRSHENILYELDGKPALDLYKDYLGEEAEKLPASALLFPLTIKKEDEKENSTVRTILSVDEAAKSMTFAGDIPQGAMAQLMMANFDKLIEGADEAASHTLTIDDVLNSNDGEKLAILISCVGRKLVLGPKISEEVEATSDIFDKQTAQIGFYSYGEVSPIHSIGSCQLHNQTMTITLMTEQL